MIEQFYGNKIVFDGGITLSRPENQFKCLKPDDSISFVYKAPFIMMTEIEIRLVISGLKLIRENMKIKITGQA